MCKSLSLLSQSFFLALKHHQNSLFILFFLGMEENYHFAQQQIYPGTNLFLMCYSINNVDSLENIERKWMPTVRRVCPKGMA